MSDLTHGERAAVNRIAAMLMDAGLFDAGDALVWAERMVLAACDEIGRCDHPRCKRLASP